MGERGVTDYRPAACPNRATLRVSGRYRPYDNRSMSDRGSPASPMRRCNLPKSPAAAMSANTASNAARSIFVRRALRSHRSGTGYDPVAPTSTYV